MKSKYVLLISKVLALLSLSIITASCITKEIIYSEDNPTTVKIMTYNIKHGEGEDEKISLKRISNVINRENPDIAVLQEVDKGVRRSAEVDQVRKLSSLTGMGNYFFGKNIDYQGGDYGNLTMSRFPPYECINVPLPKVKNEQRGAVKCVINVEDNKILLINTHLEHGKNHDEREKSLDKIKEIILDSSLNDYDLDAVFLSGDLNSVPDSKTYSQVNGFLEDSWAGKSEHGYTAPSERPTKRIDYIFYSKGAELQEVHVLETLASDHLPVVAKFRIK